MQWCAAHSFQREAQILTHILKIIVNQLLRTTMEQVVVAHQADVEELQQ